MATIRNNGAASSSPDAGPYHVDQALQHQVEPVQHRRRGVDNGTPDKGGIADDVAPPHAGRLLIQPIGPFQTHAPQRLAGAGNATRQEVEQTADTHRHGRVQLGRDPMQPGFLQRHAHRHQHQAGVGGVDFRDDGVFLIRLEIPVAAAGDAQFRDRQAKRRGGGIGDAFPPAQQEHRTPLIREFLTQQRHKIGAVQVGA